MHESGHFLAAILLGSEVVEFNLFPIPNVLCEGENIGNEGLAIIGSCGMLLPFITSVAFRSKRFTIWFVLQLLKGISVLSFGISVVSLLGFEHEFYAANDDILTVLRFWPDGKLFCLICLFVLTITTIFSIYNQKPIKQIYAFFEI